MRELTRAVGAEVVKNCAVTVLHAGISRDNKRHDELIRDTLGLLARIGIGGEQTDHRRLCRGLCLRVCNRLIGELFTFPAMIAVHRVVASADRCNPSDVDLGCLPLNCLEILLRALGRHIAAVEECMDPNLGQPLALCEFEHAEEMIVVAVDAARRDEPHDVQRSAARLHPAHNREQCLVLEKVAVPDIARDARQLLVDYAARTDIGVSDLGVSHLPVRQADILAGCIDLIVLVFFQQAVDHRRLCHCDRVVLEIVRVAVAEAVHDDERHRGVFKFCHNI